MTTSWLAAGITAGSWYASPATRVGQELIAAGMLILVGGGAGRPPDCVELERRAGALGSGRENANLPGV